MMALIRSLAPRTTSSLRVAVNPLWGCAADDSLRGGAGPSASQSHACSRTPAGSTVWTVEPASLSVLSYSETTLDAQPLCSWSSVLLLPLLSPVMLSGDLPQCVRLVAVAIVAILASVAVDPVTSTASHFMAAVAVVAVTAR